MRHRMASFLKVVCALAAFGLAFARSAPAHPAASRHTHSPVACNGAVRHPIEVRVRPLDPVVRGATIRLRLEATSQVGIARSGARLISAGGATVTGSRSAALGRMAPGRDASATFQVVVPQQGHRFLV